MKIYEIRHIDSGKVYVGKSKKTGSAFEKYYGSGTIIKAAVEKYGKEKFIKTILQICNNDVELNLQEKYWIKKLNSIYPNGYNIHDGGSGGDSFYHLNEDEIKTIFKKRKENNPTMYDKCRETKLKNGTNIFSQQHLLNIKKANKRRSLDPSWREKIRKIQLTKSSVEKIFTIEIISTKEIIHLKNIQEVKKFVTNYNNKNQLARKKRANYWKLLFNYKTTNMILLEKKRAHYE